MDVLTHHETCHSVIGCHCNPFRSPRVVALRHEGICSFQGAASCAAFCATLVLFSDCLNGILTQRQALVTFDVTCQGTNEIETTKHAMVMRLLQVAGDVRTKRKHLLAKFDLPKTHRPWKWPNH